MTTEIFKVAYWSDNQWCYVSDLDEMRKFKGDDFVTAYMPASFSHEDINRYVRDNPADSFLLVFPLDWEAIKSLFDKHILSVK